MTIAKRRDGADAVGLKSICRRGEANWRLDGFGRWVCGHCGLQKETQASAEGPSQSRQLPHDLNATAWERTDRRSVRATGSLVEYFGAINRHPSATQPRVTPLEGFYNAEFVTAARIISMTSPGALTKGV
jgi:hypothetical protein